MKRFIFIFFSCLYFSNVFAATQIEVVKQGDEIVATVLGQYKMLDSYYIARSNNGYLFFIKEKEKKPIFNVDFFQFVILPNEVDIRLALIDFYPLPLYEGEWYIEMDSNKGFIFENLNLTKKTLDHYSYYKKGKWYDTQKSTPFSLSSSAKSKVVDRSILGFPHPENTKISIENISVKDYREALL